MRGTTPIPSNGSVLTGMGANASNNPSRRGSRSGTPVFQPQQTPTLQQIQAHYSSPNQPFEDVILRQRTLGQDIVPSPGQPKRTESLFVPAKQMVNFASGGGGGGGGGASKGASKVNSKFFKYFSFIEHTNSIKLKMTNATNGKTLHNNYIKMCCRGVFKMRDKF